MEANRLIQVYRCQSEKAVNSPGDLVGWIAPDGAVFAGDVDQPGRVVGRIDYEEGDIFDLNETLTGWVEEEGAIIRQFSDAEDEQIGYVNEAGEVFGYTDEGEEICLGVIPDLKDAAEGAAALLLLL